MSVQLSTDHRHALETLDEIEAAFIGTRGFPEEVPSESCDDLCGCDVCDQNGCIFHKTAVLRAALAALPSQAHADHRDLTERLRRASVVNLTGPDHMGLEEIKRACAEARAVLAAIPAQAVDGWQDMPREEWEELDNAADWLVDALDCIGTEKTDHDLAQIIVERETSLRKLVAFMLKVGPSFGRKSLIAEERDGG